MTRDGRLFQTLLPSDLAAWADAAAKKALLTRSAWLRVLIARERSRGAIRVREHRKILRERRARRP
jgi:hypothetical protein